jgi:hypothetical protein
LRCDPIIKLKDIPDLITQQPYSKHEKRKTDHKKGENKTKIKNEQFELWQWQYTNVQGPSTATCFNWMN